MSAAGAPEPHRVATLFDVLSDLDPDEAERRLADECGDDMALRSAVRRLLARDRSASPGFLAPRAGRLAELLRGQDPARSAPAESGAEDGPLAGSSRLGRYYVLHRLAAGGMGVVYVGYDDTLDRRVALKVLRRGAGVREWLLREGQALGRLSHPNVVSVHEVGAHEGRVFLAMEFVEGPTLRAWLQERPRSFGDVLHLFLQAGRGLRAAHQAGLVHRDFKPDNVLIGKDGRARVVDFGIAALAQVGPAEPAAGPDPDASSPAERESGPGGRPLSSPLTQTGVLMGTPAFMSPEQFRGGRATPLSDQFSFCVALYRAAYGASPHRDGEIAQLAHCVLHDPPAPPPRLPEVPEWLGPILLRGLERDPEKRFPSMEELLRDIERHLPRDPELDDTPILRERRILTGVFIGSFVLASSPLVSDAGTRALMRPAGLLAVPAVLLLLFLAVIAWRWEGLSRNRYGRRLAGIPLIFVGAVLGHRLVALRLGLDGTQVLVEDMVVLCTAQCLVAHLFERWSFSVTACMLIPTAAAAMAPERAPLLVGALGLLSAATLVLRMLTLRHRSAEALLRPMEAEAAGAPTSPR